jgi:hypothetical protein
MQRVEQQLERGQALLPIDDGSLLHQPGGVLNLLQNDRSKEMWIVPIVRAPEQPFSDSHDIIPERLPLVFLVPDVRSLEQRNRQPLRLHEHELRIPDLCLHCVNTPDFSGLPHYWGAKMTRQSAGRAINWRRLSQDARSWSQFVTTPFGGAR